MLEIVESTHNGATILPPDTKALIFGAFFCSRGQRDLAGGKADLCACRCGKGWKLNKKAQNDAYVKKTGGNSIENR